MHARARRPSICSFPVILPALAAIAMLWATGVAAQQPAAPATRRPIATKSPAARAPEVANRDEAPADFYDQSKVGELKDGRVIVPTNQVLSPLGRQVAFAGRPTDLALSPNGHWLAVLNIDGVVIVDVESGQVVHTAPLKNGSYKGIVFSPDAARVYASNIKGTIGVFAVGGDGHLKAETPIKLPANNEAGGKNALPIGLSMDPAGKTLWAVLNLNNTLAEIDLSGGRVVREIPVGNAPYDVLVQGRRAYVSNWAGRRAKPGDTTGRSGIGIPVRVDPKTRVADDGSVSVVDLDAGKQIAEIVVGQHPAGLAATPDGRHVVVANAHSDTVSVIDATGRKVVETISTRPAEKLMFGSTPNALTFSSDGQTLYVANGTNNAVAVVKFSPPKSQLLGCFPTGWYPAAIALDAKRQVLFVANTKGVGSRSIGWQGKREVKGQKVFGFNSHDYLGTVSLARIPRVEELAAHTKTVLENNRLTDSISALAPPRPGVKPLPIPARHGEPSVFKHVIYIIKENRTYDQVLGDIEKGEGDPKLCIFGRDVTPNHHKLAEEFVLLDNFYCSGVLSADGHQWTNEAYVTDYLEKAFGDFPRSYPYPGGDAMAYAPTGFIWDNVLSHKKTLRVYGEFVSATIRWKDAAKKGRPTFLQCYRDFVDGTGLIDVQAKANIKTLEPYLCPTAIGFPGIVPDVHRAAQFIADLKRFEQQGRMPNFSIMLLPNDHTAGTREGMPTPEAAVADNDLALGRIVEAVSHSKFWADTCIFVVEDDPQAGFDHIDGHRTVALVISPYTRRRAIDSTNYNQTSMVRTVELILGLPPMNQLDASATSMANCFAATSDPTPYDSAPNQIPLDRLNVKLSAIRDPRQLHWAQESAKLDLEDVDRADENIFNRILWHAMRGSDDTYPAWAVLADGDDDDHE
jgi:YVTN family beta-propeller protein